jgi:cystathionine gamma-synthase/O-succinylhomoserine sulfhydrylase
MQRPLELGADVVAYAATKLMDGQGRVLAGAVCGRADWINTVLLPYQRNTGPTLSPFAAWVVLKGLETLDLRAKAQSAAALQVGQFVESRVPRIIHPGLDSHPQRELVEAQMIMPGTIFSFEIDGGREAAHAVLDALELIDISNNIGDAKSLMTHPASTTHSSLTPQVRADMGVSEGMLRISVGLEDPLDLIDDLDQALRKVGL